MNKEDQSFQERIDAIYDELWQIDMETALSVEDSEGLMKVIDLIDDLMGR